MIPVSVAGFGDHTRRHILRGGTASASAGMAGWMAWQSGRGVCERAHRMSKQAAKGCWNLSVADLFLIGRKRNLTFVDKKKKYGVRIFSPCDDIRTSRQPISQSTDMQTLHEFLRSTLTRASHTLLLFDKYLHNEQRTTCDAHGSLLPQSNQSGSIDRKLRHWILPKLSDAMALTVQRCRRPIRWDSWIQYVKAILQTAN